MSKQDPHEELKLVWVEAQHGAWTQKNGDPARVSELGQQTQPAASKLDSAACQRRIEALSQLGGSFVSIGADSGPDSEVDRLLTPGSMNGQMTIFSASMPEDEDTSSERH